MKKLLLTALTVVIVIAGVSVALAQSDSSSPSATTTTTTPTTTTPDQPIDISGNCDEAEHASDPECAGVAGNVPPDDDPDRQRTDNSGPGSVSGHDDDLVEDDDMDDDDGFDDDTGTGHSNTATSTSTGGDDD